MSTAPINLGTCYPRVAGQDEHVFRHLRRVLDLSGRDFAAPLAPRGDAGDCAVIGRLLGAREGRDGTVLAGSGQAALAAALLALCPESGTHVAVEEWSFPNALGLLRRIGAKLTILPMDQHGLKSEALEEAGRSGARVLYTMPTVHNPLGITMPLDRRREVAAIAERFGMNIVEDDAYAFLDDLAPPPLQTLLPEQTLRVASLSKMISLSLRLGAVVVPAQMLGTFEQRLRMTGTAANPIMAAVAASLAEAGEVEEFVAAKQREGRARQALLREVLPAGASALPSSWYGLVRTGGGGLAVMQRARAEGVTLSDGASFRPDAEDVPAIRLSVGAEADMDRLRQGLAIAARCVDESFTG